MREFLEQYFTRLYGDERVQTNLQFIDKNLKQAQIWSQRKLSATPTELWRENYILTVLRSPELMIPEISRDKEITSGYWSFGRLFSWVNTRRNDKFVYEEVARKRSGLPEEVTDVLGLDTISPNRLLIYEPNLCLEEGACLPASNGFFDSEDCPPWDTWVTSLRVDGSTLILSYLPEEFDADIDQGIRASSTGCIFRATDLNSK